MSRDKGALARAILDRMERTADRGDLAQQIAAYLVSQRRVRDLDSVLREVDRLRLQKSGVVEATVTSARPLSDSLREEVRQLIRQQLPGTREVVMDLRTDPSLLGGVRVSTAQYELDASVRGKLQRLRNL